MADDALAALDDMITRLRSVKGAIDASAQELVPLVKAEFDAQIAAGTGPDGTPWPAKKGGGRPLANAAKALTVKALGNTILVTLTGPEVFHNFGAGGKPRRPILPDGGVPLKFGEAIRRGLTDVWNRTVAKTYDKNGRKPKGGG